MSVLASVLAQGESSPLYQHLVKDKQLATRVIAQADDRRGPSLFYIYALLRPGVKPEDCENAIRDEIAVVQKDGVTAQELDKAHIQFLRGQIQSRQTDLGVAMELGQYAVFFNDPGLVNTVVEKFDAVTAEQVKAAAQRYLVTEQLTVVTDLPAASQSKAAHARTEGK
jgi:zinc protease